MANKKATRESYGEALALLADENNPCHMPHLPVP